MTFRFNRNYFHSLFTFDKDDSRLNLKKQPKMQISTVQGSAEMTRSHMFAQSLPFFFNDLLFILC
jgi:hypothetical protein